MRTLCTPFLTFVSVSFVSLDTIASVAADGVDTLGVFVALVSAHFAFILVHSLAPVAVSGISRIANALIRPDCIDASCVVVTSVRAQVAFVHIALRGRNRVANRVPEFR